MTKKPRVGAGVDISDEELEVAKNEHKKSLLFQILG